MKTEIQKTTGFSLAPRNLDEAIKFAEILSKSSMVPKDYQGRPYDILVAVQYGAEIGLKPLQALQGIAVINGKPSVYGDAANAIVSAHPTCIDIVETYDKEKMEAVCIAKRKGRTDVTHMFNKEKAVTAKLWGKPGPWSQYPDRMLQMRARGFALRDQFSDVLQGFILAEEAQDYVDVTPQSKEKSAPLHTAIRDILPDLSSKPLSLFNNWTDKEMDIMPEALMNWLENKLKLINTANELEVMEQFLLSNKPKLAAWAKVNKDNRIAWHSFHSGLAVLRMKFVEDEKFIEVEAQKNLAEKHTEEPEVDDVMEGDLEYQEAMRV